MDAEDKSKKLPPGSSLPDKILDQPSAFIVKRAEITAGFDERQKQLFDQALLAILTVDLPAEELAKAMQNARDVTIQVLGWEILADTRLAPKKRESPKLAYVCPYGSTDCGKDAKYCRRCDDDYAKFLSRIGDRW